MLDKTVSVNLSNVTLHEALDKIAKLTDVKFVFVGKSLEGNKTTLKVHREKLGTVLQKLLDPYGLSFTVMENNIVIKSRIVPTDSESSSKLTPPPALAPKPEPSSLSSAILPSASQSNPIRISGTVKDEKGDVLPGVSIVIKGSTQGTTTDGDGKFTITIPDNQSVLVFSFVGYQSQSVTVGSQTSLQITLKGDVKSLEELVVIGYGTQKRTEITGAITSVSGKEVSKVTAAGFQEALQGKVAGVNITPTSGQPGGALDMNIRGVATFGSGNPLFVIDGVPILSEGTSRNFNPLASLNPDNIQSIQILKDASASAIYGARAANGVVLITTNRGSDGATKIQFKASAGVSEVTRFLPLMNSAQYIPYATEAYQNAGRAIPVSLQEPLRSKNLNTNTDWQREAFKPAGTQNYWLGVSGGSPNSNYSFSLGYLNQDGTLPNSGFKRYSTRINSDFKISNRLKIGETVELSRSIWTGTFNQASWTIRQLNQQSPTVPVYDPNALGGFDGPRLEYSPVGRQNSIGELSLTDNNRTENKALGNAYVELEIIPGLTNRFSAGGEVTYGGTYEFLPTYVMGDRNRTVAILNESSISNNTYLVENVLTYKRSFNSVHNVSVLAGLSQQRSWLKSVAVEVRNFPNNDLRTVAAAFENRNIIGNETGWGLRSQMGRFNYAYKQKYNLMATIRRDGSSRFGKNNRYGVFPSISGSWLINNESFMSGIKAISAMTLRASHGQVGSQDISNFAQYATISQGVNYVFGSSQALSPGSTYLSLGNPDLKWEVTTQTNIGLDVSLFNNKLSLVMDYYVKNTDDILLQLPIPTTSGIRRDNGAFVNAGSMQNKGFEFTTTYQNKIGQLNYLVSGNISTNQNKITHLNSGLPILVQLNSGKQSALTYTREGYEIGSFYGYVVEGIFKDQEDLKNHATQPGSGPGDVKFKDINNDGVIDALDQTVIGSPFPNFVYGVNANLEYKNFDLSVSLNGKQGHQIYNLLWSDLNEGEGDNNATTEMLNRWTPTNTNTDVPRAITGNPGLNTRTSTRFLENASFMRIQNIQLGYTLPPSIGKKWNLSLRVWASAKNLATFTKYRGYNPEIGLLNENSRSSLTRGIDFGMYPIPRTLEAGLQIGFN